MYKEKLNPPLIDIFIVLTAVCFKNKENNRERKN